MDKDKLVEQIARAADEVAEHYYSGPLHVAFKRFAAALRSHAPK